LDLGCDGSAYLPYFSNYFGFEVSGIENLESSVDLARKMCQEKGVSPTLYCADFFEVPAVGLQNVDVIASFGVLEHFTDTDETVRAFSRFVRSDGLLLTVVPNKQG
jgi:2-polyprenyl-3-methyl-5-hydroxy-6-metoxy-1,4-benzoquinol methylase